MMRPTILPQTDFQTCLNKESIHGTAHFLADGNYLELTPNDVQVKLARTMDRVCTALGLEYDPETFDCDDFALLAAAIARVLHKKTAPGVKAGVAFGEVWSAPMQHAFNVAVHGHSVRYYEPQRGRHGFRFSEIKPTLVQRRGIYLCKA